MKRVQFMIELRGQEVEIELLPCAPEPDVGIMGWWSEGERITDADGKELVWELTEEELEKVSERLNEEMTSRYADAE